MVDCIFSEDRYSRGPSAKSFIETEDSEASLRQQEVRGEGRDSEEEEEHQEGRLLPSSMVNQVKLIKLIQFHVLIFAVSEQHMARPGCGSSNHPRDYC